MKTFQHLNLTKFDLLVNTIKNEIDLWRVVNILFNKGAAPDPKITAQQLEAYFDSIEGVIFNLKDDEFVVLAKLGREPDTSAVKQGISQKFPHHSCKVETCDFSRNGLQTIKIYLSAAAQKSTAANNGSQQKKFFIVDDDFFIRRTLGHILATHGQVVEFEGGENVAVRYGTEHPDIVFIDLHLPNISGIDIMNDILASDAAANIIVISADSTADNVLQAQAKGSKGFLGKPLSRDKIDKIVKSITG